MANSNVLVPLWQDVRDGGLLPHGVLERFAERASSTDRDDRVAGNDLDELKAAAYPLAPLPSELGGPGLSLADTCIEQRRLAYHAPRSARAIQSHLAWMGVAADLWRNGDGSLEWMLQAAKAGASFAVAYAEHGNDVPLCYTTATAERVDGGYRFTGRKRVEGPGTEWTFIGLHGMDYADPDAPGIVHGFLPHESAGYRIVSSAGESVASTTQYDADIVLEGAFVADRHIARVVPAGFRGLDCFVLGILTWTLLGDANILYGATQRICDDVVAALKRGTSLAITRGSMIHHAGCQDAVAGMALELAGVQPHLDRVALEWSERATNGDGWTPALLAAHYHAAEVSRRVADMAQHVLTSFGASPSTLSQHLVADTRIPGTHATNRFLTREVVGKSVLGVDLDEQPRWG